MSASGIRINKYLADKGLCSRREAEELILQGWILVNGEVLKELSYRVQTADKVEVKQQARTHLEKKLTLLIHKPIGFVSAQAEEDYTPAIRLTTSENYFGPGKPPHIRHQGFAPAGRLDIDSSGLLILTQNGKLAKQVIQANSEVEKEYLVTVEGKITQEKISRLRYGLTLDGKALKSAQITLLQDQHLKFVLKEGKKRQIRRMCELVDLKVTKLKRVRIGFLQLGSLPVGKWRLLKQNERI